MLAIVAIIAIVVLADVVTVIHTRTYTCAMCRRHRVISSVGGYVISDSESATELSSHLATRVATEHSHVWTASGLSHLHDILGLRYEEIARYECSPIWSINERDQLEWYGDCVDDVCVKQRMDSLARVERLWVIGDKRGAWELARALQEEMNQSHTKK